MNNVQLHIPNMHNKVSIQFNILVVIKEPCTELATLFQFRICVGIL